MMYKIVFHRYPVLLANQRDRAKNQTTYRRYCCAA